MNKIRYKIGIEYCGTSFHGWQKQNDFCSVQGEIENAAKKLFNSEDIDLYGSSRTDAGVHAIHQVAHLDVPLEKERSDEQILRGLNFYLRDSLVSILYITKCDFHARYDAVERTYIYKILNRQSQSVIYNNHFWHIRKDLDVLKMHQAASLFNGTHDFKNFYNKKSDAERTIRTINYINLVELSQNDYHKEIIIEIRSKSFLHNQIRCMVGAIASIGLGSLSLNELKTLLYINDRIIDPNDDWFKKAKRLFKDMFNLFMNVTKNEPAPKYNKAAAHGLYLKDVKY